MIARWEPEATSVPKAELPTRGLWFVAYVMPWLGVLVALVNGPDSEAAFTLASGGVSGLFLWYGVSRRRLWGWWLFMGLLVMTPFGALGTALVSAGVNVQEHPLAVMLGGVMLSAPSVAWGVYFIKRKHLFHRKVKGNEAT